MEDGGAVRQGGGDIVLARSTDGGAHWSSTRLTDSAHEPGNTGFGSSGGIGSSRVQGSDVAVASNGDVYVVFWFGGTQAGRGGRVEMRPLGRWRRDLPCADLSVRQGARDEPDRQSASARELPHQLVPQRRNRPHTARQRLRGLDRRGRP